MGLSTFVVGDFRKDLCHLFVKLVHTANFSPLRIIDSLGIILLWRSFLFTEAQHRLLGPLSRLLSRLLGPLGRGGLSVRAYSLLGFVQGLASFVWPFRGRSFFSSKLPEIHEQCGFRHPFI